MNHVAGTLAGSAFCSVRTEWHVQMTTDPSGDERVLVREARSGDGEAIGSLVERYSPGLFRFLIRLSGDRALAEDLLQDTWLRAMEHLDSYRPNQPFGNWLFGIARNRALDVLRQQSRRRPHRQIAAMGDEKRPAEEVADPGPSILDCLTELDLARCVFQVMKTLPVAFREVLSLRFEQGLEVDAIARALGLSSSAVKDRLYRGLDQLRMRTRRLTKHERT